VIKKPPLIFLFDMETGVAAADNILFGTNAPVLIDPSEAINWIANGTFSDSIGPKPWIEFQEEALVTILDRAGGAE
jgi:hypothetical protein